MGSLKQKALSGLDFVFNLSSPYREASKVAGSRGVCARLAHVQLRFLCSSEGCSSLEQRNLSLLCMPENSGCVHVGSVCPELTTHGWNFWVCAVGTEHSDCSAMRSRVLLIGAEQSELTAHFRKLWACAEGFSTLNSSRPLLLGAEHSRPRAKGGVLNTGTCHPVQPVPVAPS